MSLRSTTRVTISYDDMWYIVREDSKKKEETLSFSVTNYVNC